MTDSARQQFRLFANYNRAANQQLFAACATVSPSALTKPSSAPYSSILGLLEHLLASDGVWLARFEGDEGAQLSKSDAPERSLTELSRARDVMDSRIESFAERVSEQELDRVFNYKNSRGEGLSAPISLLLLHMFNHQTHHRGQVQVLLREAGVTGVSLDLHRLLGTPSGA